MKPVRTELLNALAATAPKEAAGPKWTGTGPAPSTNGYAHDAGPYKSKLDVPKWLNARNISFRIKPGVDKRGRTIYVLAVCPFNPDHADPDCCIMQGPNGLAAKCFHASCAGVGWKVIKERIGKPDADHYDPPLQTKKDRFVPPTPAGAPDPQASRPATGDYYPLTDYGNAQRLAGRYSQNFRHVHPWKKSLVFDGARWHGDNSGETERMAKRTVRAIYREAEEAKSKEEREALSRHAMASEENRRIKAMIDLARSEPMIPIQPADLDRDPWLLNCFNGTLNLRTGILREHRRDDYCTKITEVEYDPRAVCPRFLEFLSDIFDDDTALIAYLSRLAGYWLTGVIYDHVLPVFWGTGANGKSTLLNVLLQCLGNDYSIKAPSDLLLVKRGESHPTEKALLHGKRLVVTIETDEGRRLAEALVKDLTGGDRITARRMREDFWEFVPTHKIVLVTNHKPVIAGTDYAIWRRVQLVPFSVTIPVEKRDPRLPEKLAAELPGILAWCVRGCLEWQRMGLQPPESVTAATKDYRDSQDVLREFLTECCVEKPGQSSYRVKASVLYAAYVAWCDRSGEDKVNQRRFGQAMTERGFMRDHSDGTWYTGLVMREQKNEPVRDRFD